MGTLAQAYEQAKTNTGTELPQGTLSRAFAGILANKSAPGSSISGPGARAQPSSGSADPQLPPGAIAGAVGGIANGIGQGASALANTGIAEKVGASGLLSKAGNVASGVGGAANVVGGVQQGGVKGYGSALAGGAQVADALGAGGTVSNTAGLVGNAASGNYIGAAKDAAQLIKGGSAASGAAAAGASEGAAAATSAGSAATTGAGSAVSAIGTVGAAAGLVAAFIGAAQMAVHAFGGGLSQKRNVATFTAALGDNLQKGAFPYGRGVQSFYKIPGKGWVDAKTFQDIAGAWYGATYAPDGDQAGWQQKLNDVWSNSKPLTPADMAKYDSRQSHSGVQAIIDDMNKGA